MCYAVLTMLATITNYQERIREGKVKEKLILDTLRQQGMVIEDATADEDKNDKIDGWIVEDGKRYALQVKFRETGDDILFEVVKDLDKNIPGRDAISKAHYYLVVDRYGTARLFLTAPIKKLAQQMLPIAKGLFGTRKTEWRGIGWELKITVDRAHGNTKLMAYFNPGKFDCLKEWNMKL